MNCFNKGLIAWSFPWVGGICMGLSFKYSPFLFIPGTILLIVGVIQTAKIAADLSNLTGE